MQGVDIHALLDAPDLLPRDRAREVVSVWQARFVRGGRGSQLWWDRLLDGRALRGARAVAAFEAQTRAGTRLLVLEEGGAQVWVGGWRASLDAAFGHDVYVAPESLAWAFATTHEDPPGEVFVDAAWRSAPDARARRSVPGSRSLGGGRNGARCAGRRRK